MTTTEMDAAQRAFEDLCNGYLRRELGFEAYELRGLTLEQKTELMPPEELGRILDIVSMGSVASGKSSLDSLSRDLLVHIVARLPNRALARLCGTNKAFHARCKDWEFMNQVLTRRHGALYDRAAYERRLQFEPSRYPMLAVRVFDLVSAFWDRRSDADGVGTIARFYLEPVADKNGRVTPFVYIAMLEKHLFRRGNDDAPRFDVEWEFGRDGARAQKIKAGVAGYMNMLLPSRDTIRRDNLNIRDSALTRADVEGLVLHLMSLGLTRVRDFRVEFMRRETDDWPMREPDFSSVVAPLIGCAACGNSNAQRQCGGGCRQALYCGDACAQAHWPEHWEECRK